MDTAKISRFSTYRPLRNEEGFALVLFLGLLPIIISAMLILLFSQYLVKNWMESMHICRTELLATQKRTSLPLRSLMALNPQVKLLRIAMIQAQAELAAALASQNYGWAANVQKRILQIQKQQRLIAMTQKTLIATADALMIAGPMQTLQKLISQDLRNRSRLPDFFKFRIQQITPNHQRLAVRPDSSDSPPVYELKENFRRQQALNISWISVFSTTERGPLKWITNTHKKKDSCEASLEAEGQQSFHEILNGDKAP